MGKTARGTLHQCPLIEVAWALEWGVDAFTYISDDCLYASVLSCDAILHLSTVMSLESTWQVMADDMRSLSTLEHRWECLRVRRSFDSTLLARL